MSNDWYLCQRTLCPQFFIFILIFQFLSLCFWWGKGRFNFILSLVNNQLVIDKPVTYIMNISALCSFGLDLYVDIASMYRLHKETDHSLRPVVYRWNIVKIIKVQEWILLELCILIRQFSENFLLSRYGLNLSIPSYENQNEGNFCNFDL